MKTNNNINKVTDTQLNVLNLGIEPLRVCRVCGAKAYTEAELETFSKNDKMTHGRGTICKCCDSKKASKYHKEHYEKTGGKGGFDKNKKAILYYVEIIDNDKNSYFKIGITNRTISERFTSENDVKIKVLFQKKFDGQVAQVLEKSIINEHKDLLVKRKTNILRYTGNSEIFSEDIFNLK